MDEAVSRRALYYPQGSPAVYLKYKKNIGLLVLFLPDGYAMLMRPNKAETAVRGCHFPGDMVVCMRKVKARPWVGVRVCPLRSLFFFYLYSVLIDHQATLNDTLTAKNICLPP